MGGSGPLGPLLKEVGDGTSWETSNDVAFGAATGAPGDGADEDAGREGWGDGGVSEVVCGVGVAAGCWGGAGAGGGRGAGESESLSLACRGLARLGEELRLS